MKNNTANICTLGENKELAVGKCDLIEGQDLVLEEPLILEVPEEFKFKSYIDPSLQVTEDLYAISYVKKSYASDTTMPEHAFIIMQTFKEVRRA
jgi:hypothetical protein